MIWTHGTEIRNLLLFRWANRVWWAINLGPYGTSVLLLFYNQCLICSTSGYCPASPTHCWGGRGSRGVSQHIKGLVPEDGIAPTSSCFSDTCSDFISYPGILHGFCLVRCSCDPAVFLHSGWATIVSAHNKSHHYTVGLRIDFPSAVAFLLELWC